MFDRPMTNPLLAAASLIALIWPGPAVSAQGSSCSSGNVHNGPLLHFAAISPTLDPLPWGTARVTYVGHSSFMIESPGGVSVFTDLNSLHKPPFLPDIVTLNNANSDDIAGYMEGRIPHVLRGWDPGGGTAQHDIRLKDMHVFNLPTNVIRMQGQEVNGNSIFVIEAGGLCIAHLGSIQHILDEDASRALTGVDVLIVPIDGDVNLSHAEVMMIIKEAAPKLVIPMHLQLPGPAKAFRTLAERFYPVRDHKGPPLVLRRDALPKSTQVLFMEP